MRDFPITSSTSVQDLAIAPKEEKNNGRRGVDFGDSKELPLYAVVEKWCMDPKTSFYMVAGKIMDTAKILEIAEKFKSLSRTGSKLSASIYCYRGFSWITSEVGCFRPTCLLFR